MLQRLRQKLQPSDDAVRVAKLGLRLTLEIAERACDGLPIPAAQGSITALLAILRGIERMSRNAEALEELAEHVRYIHQEVVLPVQDALEKAEASVELRGVLAKFSSDLDTAMQPWKTREPQNFVKRLVNSEDQEGEIQKLASSIKMVIERYQLSAHVRGEFAFVRLEGKTARMSRQVDAHVEQQDSRERSRLINALPRAVKATYDSGREGGPISCLPGTRVTVLSELQNWLEDPRALHVFWLSGLAGTGKSTIARSIAESAFVRDYLGATFFCSALSDGSLANPEMIISTLAFQLSRNIPRFKTALADALEEDPDVAHRDLDTQVLRLLIEPLKVVNDFDVVLLVVDGLDECLPERTCASLLRSVLTHAANVPILRVLVSCRPEHHLRAAFANSTGAYQQLTLHDVEANLVQHDIHLYLHSALAAIPRELNLPNLSDWPRDRDVAALADKSGQLFVYAATAVRFIAHDRVRDPQRQLDVLLGMRSVANGNPYSQLDSLYIHLLSSALPDDSEPEDVERFKCVLGTILCSREVLSISALSCFAGIEPAAVSRTLYHLHSVVVSSDEAPRIYHPSFAEFITDPRRCTERFCIYPEGEEQDLAVRSLDLLANGLQRGMSITELTPQIRYASRYWAVHVDACSGHDAVMAPVEAFAHDNLVFWLEAMCIMGLIHTVPSLLAGVHKQIAMSCTQSGQVVPVALELLDDAYRFALIYGEVLHGAPEHIYLSALPFVPSSSALFQTYEAEAIDGVIVLRPFERHWTPLLRSLNLQSCEMPLRASALSPTGSVIALVRMSGCLELLDMDAPSAGEAKSQLLTLSMNTRDATDHRLAFSSNGRLLACAYVPSKGPPTIDVWDVASHTLVHTSSEQSSSASPSMTIAVAPDGQHIASIALDIKAMRLSVRSMRKKERVAITHPLSSQTSDPCLIFFEATGTKHGCIAIGTCDGVFVMDDLAKRSPTRLRPHDGAATAVAVTHDNSLLASTFCGAELALALWDTTTLLCLYTLSLSSNPITSLAFREDGGQLALGSQDGQLILYEREDAAAFAPSAYITIAESQSAVTGIAYSSDAIRLHTGTAYGVYKQWHLRDLSRSPRIVDTLPIGLPEHCAFSANGAFIALPVGEYTVSAAVYDARTGAHILDCTSSPHTHWDSKMDPLGAPPPIRVTALAFSPDGTILAAACASERTYALFWDTRTGTLTRTLNLAYMGLHVDVSGLSFSADNSVLYAHLRQSTTLHLPGTRVFQPPAPGKLAYDLRTDRMPALLPERNADEEDPEALHVWVDEEDALRMRHADMVFEDSILLARLPAGTIKRAFGYGDRVVGVSPAGKVCILDISNFV